MYFAQNRFYDAETHRFTQEDPIKDGANWYIYCENNHGINVDAEGLFYRRETLQIDSNSEDVRLLQIRLNEKNRYDSKVQGKCYAGTPDGMFGETTENANNVYEENQKLRKLNNDKDASFVLFTSAGNEDIKSKYSINDLAKKVIKGE